jgi:hypothetical protein
MYVCMYVCMYVYTHACNEWIIHMHLKPTFSYIYIYIYIYVCMYVWAHSRTVESRSLNACVNVYMPVYHKYIALVRCSGVYMCMCARISTHEIMLCLMHLWMYICMYVYPACLSVQMDCQMYVCSTILIVH